MWYSNKEPNLILCPEKGSEADYGSEGQIRRVEETWGQESMKKKSHTSLKPQWNSEKGRRKEERGAV